MIKVEGLTRRFGALTAVDALSLEIPDGEVFGLLGPNGAGKTTTLRMLSGLIGITSGTAVIDGLDVRDQRQAVLVRARLGLLPEENGLYGDLTAWQTLDFYARLHHVRNRELRVGELLERLALLDRKDDPVSTFSKGMKQRLAIARALVNEPRMVFLDEPTANLDPQASLDIRELIVDLQRRGCTIIINTHRLEEAERVCDRIGILRTRLLRVANARDLGDGHASVLLSLDQPSESVLAAVGRATVVAPELVGDAYRLRLRPAFDVPDLVALLVASGAPVQSVVSERTTLETLYLEAIADAS